MCTTHPICCPVSDGHTVAAMMAEGGTLQYEFALQPFLICLRVRDGNLSESLLCIVATGLEAPSVVGYKELSALKENNAKAINWYYPTGGSRKEEKRSSLLRGKTSK